MTANGSEQVAAFLSDLEHPLKKGMETIREIILSANGEITEHIKWKAPSFCIDGDDRVTFNLHKDECITLVFHKGAKGKESKGRGAFLEDRTGILQWLSDERAVVKFYSLEEIAAKRDSLKEVVTEWIKQTRV